MALHTGEGCSYFGDDVVCVSLEALVKLSCSFVVSTHTHGHEHNVLSVLIQCWPVSGKNELTYSISKEAYDRKLDVVGKILSNSGAFESLFKGSFFFLSLKWNL